MDAACSHLYIHQGISTRSLMQTEPILTETIADIGCILGTELDRITVERAVIGLFFTGVKLDTGIAGACATPLRSIPEAVCCPMPSWPAASVCWAACASPRRMHSSTCWQREGPAIISLDVRRRRWFWRAE
jgi:hypothetical protein